MNVTIIGIDCATKEEKVGLARGVWDGEEVKLAEPPSRGVHDGVAKRVSDWIIDSINEKPSQPVLLSLDAPLGWPEAMGCRLLKHRAGQFIDEAADNLFMRRTEEFVKGRFKDIFPLEVGANRIGRTAHAALTLLRELRTTTQLPIPLGWDPRSYLGVSVIEVYPAVTLYERILPHEGYKKNKKDHQANRSEIIAGLREHMTLTGYIDLLESDHNILDAAVCVLAGFDFLSEVCYEPKDLELAKREGWIWVRDCEKVRHRRALDQLIKAQETEGGCDGN